MQSTTKTELPPVVEHGSKLTPLILAFQKKEELCEDQRGLLNKFQASPDYKTNNNNDRNPWTY